MGVSRVLVGRDTQRLGALAARIVEGTDIVLASSPEQIATEIKRRQPLVVLNTIGPFARTAVPIAGACLPGGH